jgi:nucleoside-specific outer membrane channel protein Tsx
MRYLLIVAVLASSAAFAADLIAARPPATTVQPLLEEEDGAVELQWDNGTRMHLMCFYSGAGVYLGNDFDITQMPEYSRVTRMLVYSSPEWPNDKWDGFRIGLYGYSGGVPSSLLWGPKFVKGNLASEGWTNFSVAWSLPVGQKRFVAAVEQYYDFPNLDPYAVDDNTDPAGHSWHYQSGAWSAYPGYRGYHNVMIRVRVSDALVDMVPTSIGRVKALYF